MPETTDFLVVGGGVAGLTAGALLARAGHRVSLFEKHSKLGGYAQYFGHDPTFDSATHLIGGAGAEGWARSVLQETGALDRVDLLPLDPVYEARFPGHSYLAPADPQRFRQELSALWPAEAEAIGRFFSDMEAIGRDYLTLRGGIARSGPLAENRDRTLGAMLDGITSTPELRAALGALWLFAGLPPERVSALHYGMLWHSFHSQGSAAVKGGVRELTRVLSEIITERGGTVENNVRVSRILRRGGRVTGAVLEDGREFQARAVLSTASPYDTFEDLLEDPEQKPAGYPPLQTGFAVSTSSVQVHLLVNGPLEVSARTTLLHSTCDLREAYFDLQRDEPGYQALVCTVLDRGDPERVPSGKHMISLFTLAPYSRGDDWEVAADLRRGKGYRMLPDYLALKEQVGDAMVARASELLPGLPERIEARKVGTPITMERYTFNTGGAAFGWANVPEQCGPNRPGPETTFAGLYLAGHWTFPGGSLAAAAQSGRLAAEAMLGK